MLAPVQSLTCLRRLATRRRNLRDGGQRGRRLGAPRRAPARVCRRGQERAARKLGVQSPGCQPLPGPRPTFSKSWPWVVKAWWKAAASSALQPAAVSLIGAATLRPLVRGGQAAAAARAPPHLACGQQRGHAWEGQGLKAGSSAAAARYRGRQAAAATGGEGGRGGGSPGRRARGAVVLHPSTRAPPAVAELPREGREDGRGEAMCRGAGAGGASPELPREQPKASSSGTDAAVASRGGAPWARRVGSPLGRPWPAHPLCERWWAAGRGGPRCWDSASAREDGVSAQRAVHAWQLLRCVLDAAFRRSPPLRVRIWASAAHSTLAAETPRLRPSPSRPPLRALPAAPWAADRPLLKHKACSPPCSLAAAPATHSDARGVRARPPRTSRAGRRPQGRLGPRSSGGAAPERECCSRAHPRCRTTGQVGQCPRSRAWGGRTSALEPTASAWSPGEHAGSRCCRTCNRHCSTRVPRLCCVRPCAVLHGCCAPPPLPVPPASLVGCIPCQLPPRAATCLWPAAADPGALPPLGPPAPGPSPCASSQAWRDQRVWRFCSSPAGAARATPSPRHAPLVHRGTARRRPASLWRLACGRPAAGCMHAGRGAAAQPAEPQLARPVRGACARPAHAPVDSACRLLLATLCHPCRAGGRTMKSCARRPCAKPWKRRACAGSWRCDSHRCATVAPAARCLLRCMACACLHAGAAPAGRRLQPPAAAAPPSPLWFGRSPS